MMISNMEFDCKLAHCKEIKRLSQFNSIKELYERISQAFSISTDQILFCTLNTHNSRDMNALLGNYLSLGDLIVVHLCGPGRDLRLKKSEEYLGLTITDNGLGRAFIKKIKPNEDHIEDLIKPGDHIATINIESVVGKRHFEVANAIRELPKGIEFTLHLIEPIRNHENDLTDDKVPDKLDFNSHSGNKISLLDSDESNLAGGNQFDRSLFDRGLTDSIYDDLTNSSLPIERLLSKSPSGVSKGQEIRKDEHSSTYKSTIERINSILESFLGINDNILAIRIYRLARDNKDSFGHFTEAIKSSELNAFNFGHEIETHLWNCVKSCI